MAGEVTSNGDDTDAAVTLTPNPRVAWAGCSVLLDVNNGDHIIFARLSPNAYVTVAGKKYPLTPLIGCPFGSLFSVEDGPNGRHLARCVSSSSLDTDAASMQERGNSHSEDKTKDNRALVDNNTAQSLSSEDINAMRREGVKGDEIIEALIANSSTYATKTAFSQEKYKLKKQKKFAPKILLRRPFSRRRRDQKKKGGLGLTMLQESEPEKKGGLALGVVTDRAVEVRPQKGTRHSICDGYFKKYPTRIGFLRVHTLSMLLSMANVSAYSDVLVVDMVGGILTGAVAERIGGTGYVCNTYFGAKTYSLDIVRQFNFSNEVCSRIVQAPFSDLCSNQSHENEGSELQGGFQSSELGSNTEKVSLLVESVTSSDSVVAMEEEVSEEVALSSCKQSANCRDTSNSGNGVAGSFSMHPCSSSSTTAVHESSDSTVHRSVNPGRQASPEAIASWKKNGFTSLIVAAPEMEVGNIVQKMLPLLSYSAPFAVYHQYLQPLATCMNKLQASKLAIGLQISEPWLREYQVLPSRTHPHMQMSGSGGYILSGIRICSSEASNGSG